MRSPVANPICTGSRIQVDAVTRGVGREFGVDVCLCWGWVAFGGEVGESRGGQ